MDQVGPYLYCLSSAASPRYRQDIERAMALPAGCILRFRYDVKYVAGSVLDSVENGTAECSAVICFLENAHGQIGQVHEHTAAIVPIRLASAHLKRKGETLVVDLKLENHLRPREPSETRNGLHTDEGAPKAAGGLLAVGAPQAKPGDTNFAYDLTPLVRALYRDASLGGPFPEQGDAVLTALKEGHPQYRYDGRILKTSEREELSHLCEPTEAVTEQTLAGIRRWSEHVSWSNGQDLVGLVCFHAKRLHADVAGSAEEGWRHGAESLLKLPSFQSSVPRLIRLGLFRQDTPGNKQMSPAKDGVFELDAGTAYDLEVCYWHPTKRDGAHNVRVTASRTDLVDLFAAEAPIDSRYDYRKLAFFVNQLRTRRMLGLKVSVDWGLAKVEEGKQRTAKPPLILHIDARLKPRYSAVWFWGPPVGALAASAAPALVLTFALVRHENSINGASYFFALWLAFGLFAAVSSVMSVLAAR